VTEIVAIVFDGEFADRLGDLRGRDIWVIASATNVSVIERMRRTDRKFRATTFGKALEHTSKSFEEILRSVDLHHGPYSQNPPYSRIEVFGIRPNRVAKAAIASIGFEAIEPTADGFTARRSTTT
jgi:hypothetical protein